MSDTNTNTNTKRNTAAFGTVLAIVAAVVLYVIAATSEPKQTQTSSAGILNHMFQQQAASRMNMYITPGGTAVPLLPKQLAEMKVLQSKKILQLYGRTTQGYPTNNTLAQCRRPTTTTPVFKCILHVRGKNQKTLWYNQSTKKISEQG